MRLLQIPPFICASLLLRLARSWNQSVALLLRGESFRSGWQLVSKYSPTALRKRYAVRNRGALGPHKRSTCEEGTREQEQKSRSHLELVHLFESWNFWVDVYIATYNCSNGKPYASLIPSFYSPKPVQFDVLPQRDSNMMTTIAHVFQMALSTRRPYDYYVSIRIDSNLTQRVQRFSMWQPHCFFDAHPRDGKFYGWPNPDNIELTPALHAKRFLDFLRRGVGRTVSGFKNCCNAYTILKDGTACGVGCYYCARNFQRYLNLNWTAIYDMRSPCLQTQRSLSTAQCAPDESARRRRRAWPCQLGYCKYVGVANSCQATCSKYVGCTASRYELYRSWASCGTRYYNFGEITTPELCAQRVVAHEGCGPQFMFSRRFKSWGCRCCAVDGADGGGLSSNWDLYTALEWKSLFATKSDGGDWRSDYTENLKHDQRCLEAMYPDTANEPTSKGAWETFAGSTAWGTSER